MSRHPRLKEIDDELRAIEVSTRAARGRRDELVLELINETLGTGYKSYELDHGTWDCPDGVEVETPHAGPVSPTGKCVYLPEDDIHRDDCLFCHGPDERK